MATTVADVRYRWYMGPEARLLLLITACLLAFGLATVYSASAILAQSKNLSYRERKLLDKARYLFVSEIAEVQRAAEADVEIQIDKAITKSFSGRTDH